MAQILVVFLWQRHLGILKREHLAIAKPFLGEHLLISIRTGIYLHVASLVVVVAMTNLIHLGNESAADSRTAEEGKRLYGKTPPLLRVGEQMHILTKGVMRGDGIQTIDYLGVFVLQSLSLIDVVVGGIKWEDIHKETDDTRSFPLLY